MRRVRQKAIVEQATAQLGRAPKRSVLRVLRRSHKLIDGRYAHSPSVHSRQGHGTPTVIHQKVTNALSSPDRRALRQAQLFDRTEDEKRWWASRRRHYRKTDWKFASPKKQAADTDQK